MQTIKLCMTKGTTKDGKTYDRFFCYFGKDFKKSIDVRLTKKANANLITSDVKLPALLDLENEDYFIATKTDKEGNKITYKDGKEVRELIIQNYQNITKAPAMGGLKLEDLIEE